MSYIPDTRERFVTPLFESENQERKENGYWHGFLNEKDQEFVRGYDWANEMSVANFFNNLDVYGGEFEEIGIDVNEISEQLDGAVPFPFYNEDANPEDYKDMDDFSEEEKERMNFATKLFLTMKSCLIDWIEMERDQLIVSMIDNMDDEEYEKIKAERLKQLEEESTSEE